jgi:NAD(P) transhydrogenase subunit alpha
VEVGGVRVLGPVNLPATVPHDASLTYAKNVANFLALVLRDGAVAIPEEDQVVQECMVCRDGEIVHARVREALEAGEVAR